MTVRSNNVDKPCSDGNYDDTDDLVFQVKRRILSQSFNENTPSRAGWINFVKRSILLKPENLNDNTLTINLRMKLDEAKSPLIFIPEYSFNQQISKLFLDKESADVLFELPVDDDSTKVEYHAHRLILKASAPFLAQLCEGVGKLATVRIVDVEAQIFLQLLQYVYRGDISPQWEKDAKKFIDAADKYGMVDLKVIGIHLFPLCFFLFVEFTLLTI